MFYTEAVTKDKVKGALIIAESVDDIIIECLKWRIDNDIPYDTLEESPLKVRETDSIYGTVTFEETGVKFTPLN